MRVRVNFTVDFDLEDLRKRQPFVTKTQARDQIQQAAQDMVLEFLANHGVDATSLGRNNAYDPETRQTIHEEYVNA